MALTLQKLKAKKEMRKKALDKNLARIKKQLQDMGALKIILFGSLTHGHINTRSDLDIISVMPSVMSGKEWMKKIYDEIDREIDCDILAYTEEELEKASKVSRFVRHALDSGRLIYEKRS